MGRMLKRLMKERTCSRMGNASLEYPPPGRSDSICTTGAVGVDLLGLVPRDVPRDSGLLGIFFLEPRTAANSSVSPYCVR